MISTISLPFKVTVILSPTCKSFAFFKSFEGKLWVPPLNAIKQPDGNMVVIVPSIVSIAGIVEITEATGNMGHMKKRVAYA